MTRGCTYPAVQFTGSISLSRWRAGKKTAVIFFLGAIILLNVPYMVRSRQQKQFLTFVYGLGTWGPRVNE